MVIAGSRYTDKKHPQDRIYGRDIGGWRNVASRSSDEPASCVGCGEPPKVNNRTCGSRKCIAVALCLSGLIAEPTVKCLNAWAKRSTLKQMVESTDTRNKTRQLLAGLTQYYESL